MSSKATETLQSVLVVEVQVGIGYGTALEENSISSMLVRE